MALTLEDIARLSGVSRSTVSRVINEEPKVSEATREKVKEVIQTVGFQRNLAARALAAGKTHVLGLVIPRGVNTIFTDPFFHLLIQGVSSTCNLLDYSVMLWLAEPEYERRTIQQVLYNGLIDGVIISAMLIDDPIVHSLTENHVPFVLVGRHPNNEQVSFVDVDNRVGARQAVLHLLRLGRQRVGCISCPQNTVPGLDRYQGYLDAMAERGMIFDGHLIEEGDFTDQSGYQCMQRLLKQMPDAVFAASDAMAWGAMRAIHEAGLRVPEDIAVVGFDDLLQSSQTHPRLTTVRQPTTRVGAMAARTLADLLQNPKEPARHVILPTQLIIRESCGSQKSVV